MREGELIVGKIDHRSKSGATSPMRKLIAYLLGPSLRLWYIAAMPGLKTRPTYIGLDFSPGVTYVGRDFSPGVTYEGRDFSPAVH